jgi:UPF0755 protein
MKNRQPAEQPFSRTSGALARSPAERLEPTRPAGPRRSRRPAEPGGGKPLLRFLNGLLTFVLMLMLLGGGAAYLFNAEIDRPGPLPHAKIVVIPKLEGTQEIAARLEKDGVISDRRVFIAGYLWSKFAAWLDNGKPVQLRAGDFDMRQNISIRQVVEQLSEGKTISYKITVPEGLTSHQIVERLRADSNLSGEIAVVPSEGSLLPETFMSQRGASRQAVIDTMAAQSKKLMEKMWAQRKKDLPLKSWEEAIILASIVEKETGRNDERDRVAGVFINRLRQNMRLQSDPTILYGLFGGKVAWGRPIQRNEIAQKTTHNTYQIDGLPPTPICNPGRAAIEAVLNPADTKDLYFVADGSGGHVFAETLKDHNANVQKWRVVEKDMKAAKAGGVGAPATSDAPGGAPNLPHTNAAPKGRSLISVPKAKKAGTAKGGHDALTGTPGPSSNGQMEKLPWAGQTPTAKDKN